MLSDEDRRELLAAQLATAGWAWTRNEGGSMAPTLALGQRVKVRRDGPIRVGAVVLFLGRDGQYVLHRVALVVPWLGFFVHVGDAQNRPAIASINSIVGLADLPVRRPSARVRVRAALRVARAVRIVAGRALRGQSMRNKRTS